MLLERHETTDFAQSVVGLRVYRPATGRRPYHSVTYHLGHGLCVCIYIYIYIYLYTPHINT